MMDVLAPNTEMKRLASAQETAIVWPIDYNTAIGRAMFWSHKAGRLAAPALTNFQGLNVSSHVALFADPSINAYATRVRNEYYVAVNMGLYLACLDIAVSLLADRDTLTSIGNVDREERSSPRHDLGRRHLQFPDANSFMHFIGSQMPQDPDRRDLASILCSLMLMFILNHEYAHIYWGHVDRLIFEDDLDVTQLTLRLNEREHAKHDPVSQVFEMIADCDSMEILLIRPLVEAIIKDIKGPLLSIPEWLSISWLGAVLATTLFGFIERHELAAIDDWKSHPHGLLRARESVLASRAQRWIKQYGDEYAEAYVLLQGWLEEISGRFSQFHVWSGLLNPSHEINEVIQRYNSQVFEPTLGLADKLQDKYRLRYARSGRLSRFTGRLGSFLKRH